MGASTAGVGNAALLIIIMSPMALTNWWGTTTPRAPPSDLLKLELRVARTRHPKTLLPVMMASSMSPK